MKCLAFASVALMALALAASAHEAPPPRSFETRVLHDHNDDSFLEMATTIHGFDTIALDVREAYAPEAQENVLVLRFTLNGGCNADAPTDCPELKLVTTFMAGGNEHSFTLRAPDDRNVFEGDGVRFVGPEHLNDGTRFAVEQWLPFSTFGGSQGTVLSDFFVTGYAGEEEADSMPQGVVPDAPDPLGAAYSIPEYALRAPFYYLDASVPSMPLVDEGEMVFTLTNRLVAEQNVSLNVSADTGIDASLAGADVIQLPALGITQVRLTVRGDAPGNVTLLATTPLGGVARATGWFMPETGHGGMPDGSVSGPDVAPGGTFRHTFTTTGTFSYHDHHSGAVGTVAVKASDAAPAKTHRVVFDGSFTPQNLTIHAGDTVEWTNDAEAMMIMGSMHAMTGGSGDHHHEDSPGIGVALIVALIGLLVVRRR